MTATANVDGKKKVFKDGEWVNKEIEHNTGVVDENYSCECNPKIEESLVIHNKTRKDPELRTLTKKLMKASLRSSEMSYDEINNLFHSAACAIELGTTRIKPKKTVPALSDIVKNLELSTDEAVVAGKVYARITKKM